MTIRLSNCNVVDLRKGVVLEDRELTVRGNVIINGSQQEIPAELYLDLGGKFLLPGLFNMHNNLTMVFPFKETNLLEPPGSVLTRWYRRACDALISGVTTLRCVGEMHRVDIYLKDAINNGSIKGPRVFASGKGIGSIGGHGSEFGQTETKGVDGFRKAAEKELKLGADHLKVFLTGGIAKEDERFEDLQMSKEEIKTVVSVARTFGKYVTAHAGNSDAVNAGVDAGLKCVEHGYVLDDAVTSKMARLGVYLVPTLSVTRSPEWMQENGFEEWTIRKALSAKASHDRSVKNAIKNGVRILVGTDIPPGDLNKGINATVREIEFLTDVGLTSLEAIRGATLYCAELCGVSDRVGLLEENFVADIIGMDKNPLKDIRALENIDFVMQRGQVIKRGQTR